MANDRFYDLCYDAWRSGKNPDSLSIDKYDAYQQVDGYYPDEITLEMMLPQQLKEEEE